MARDVTLDNGFTYTDVPDNVSDEAVRAKAVYDGDLPDPGNGVDQFLIGAGKWFADRSGGRIDNSIPAPDTLPATLGGIAPAVAAGVLGGGSALAQAGIAGTLERFREGSSWGSTAGQAGIAGATTGALNMAGRVVKGLMAQGAAARNGAPLVARIKGGLDKVLARTAAGAGGFDAVDDINTAVMNKSLQRALGLPGAAEKITEAELSAARDGISQLYTNALPTAAADVTQAAALLGQIPKEAGPQVADLLKVMQGAGNQLEPVGWQRVHSALREFRPLLARSLYATAVPKLDDVIDAMDNASAAAGGDRALLSVANQRYKLLSIAEEIDPLLVTGDVPAGQLFRKLSAKGWRGFGKRATGEGYNAGLLPETQQLIETSKLLAGEGRRLATGSPTASRVALFGPAAVAAGGLATGKLDPQEASGLALMGLAPRAAGAALLAEGGGSALTGMLGQAAAGAAGQSPPE